MGEIRDSINSFNITKENDSLDFLRNAVLENPTRFIGGAVDKILGDKKNLGESFLEENKFIFEVLKYLFPTKESYWTDEKLVSEVTKILVERKMTFKIDSSKISRFTGSSINHLEEWEKRREEELENKDGGK